MSILSRLFPKKDRSLYLLPGSSGILSYIQLSKIDKSAHLSDKCQNQMYKNARR